MGSRGLAAVLSLLLLGAVACSDEGGGRGSARGSGTPGPGEYLPGLAATVERPDGDARGVVVLVPGGSWETADPTGLRPLGPDLAAAGYAAVTITYGTKSTGDYFPRPLLDVTCAMAFAADQVPDVPVVVVGHSAGANLALLAGLHPDLADDTCPYPHVAAAGVVGLAGPYDVEESRIGSNLFGVSQQSDPELWTDGTPATWAAERPDLPVLLVQGEADELLPMWFTDTMAQALEAGGHVVRVERVPDADHNDVFRSEVLLEPLTDWLADAVIARP